jgi:hypothetical protein
MNRIGDTLRQWILKRPLTADEIAILAAVRDIYPAHPKDEIFFIKEAQPLLPVRSSAQMIVWGTNGEGPWVHLTNLAGLLRHGIMTLQEIKETQLPRQTKEGACH